MLKTVAAFDRIGEENAFAVLARATALAAQGRDIISLGTKAKEMALIAEAQSLAEREIPDYVAPDGTDKITFVRVPTLDEVPYPVKMEPNLVVEFYSR